jgi:solute carrier family 25 protein 14/30
MNSTSNEPLWVRPIAGALASQTADFFTYPIDTAKTRLQISGELGKRQLYSGMFDAIKQVRANEGFSGGLYKGFSAALLRQGGYRAIVFTIYEPLRDAIGPQTLTAKILSAGLGGAIGIVCVNPLDVLKVRMQADIAGTRYKNLRSGFRQLLFTEKLTGMFRGVIPNAQRAFLVNAAELATYDVVKKQSVTYFGDNVASYFVGSIGAGLAASIVSTPVDLVKTRLMNQPTDPVTHRGLKYRGAFDCAVKTCKAEGFWSIYKGFLPTWLRLGPYNLITFLAFEEYRRVLRTSYPSELPQLE